MDVEERAKLQGWVPKEDFRGDPEKWRPAEEFVDRADKMMPILKDTNRRLETKLSTLSEELSTTKKMVESMVKVQSKYSSDQYAEKLEDIKSKKRQAVKDGDMELYERLEMQETKIPKPEPLEPPKPDDKNHLDSVHPDVIRWGEENPWIEQDKELADYALFVGEQLRKTGSNLASPGNEYAFCKEVENKVKATFPNKFTNPNRQKQDFDEPDTRGGEQPKGGKMGWNDLPKDAQNHCKKLMADIPNFTKEQYIRDYFEGE